MGDVDETFSLRRSMQLAAADQEALLRSAARVRREAEHEVATERIVEWCNARLAQVQNLMPRAGRELEELLERYASTLPEVDR